MKDAALLKELINYDPDTGQFLWLRRDGATRGIAVWNSRYAGKRAGVIRHDGYVKIGIYDRSWLAHRLAWVFMTGEPPPKKIDHRNRIRHDNRWSNLRSATDSENNFNRGVEARNTSGHKGVYYNTRDDLWHADIWANGQRHRSAHNSKEDALNMRARLQAQLHGDFSTPLPPGVILDGPEPERHKKRDVSHQRAFRVHGEVMSLGKAAIRIGVSRAAIWMWADRNGATQQEAIDYFASNPVMKNRYEGVGFDKARRKWVATFREDGKVHHVGRFSTEEEAYQARCEFQRKRIANHA